MTSFRVTLSVWHTEPELGSSISAAIRCLRLTFLSLSCDLWNNKHIFEYHYAGVNNTPLLNDYKIGILTVLVKKDLFNNLRFNPSYNIIGDFDFFLRASMLNKIHVINKPLATYRHHDQNMSNKRIDLYIKEFIYWLERNEYKLKSFNLLSLKFNIFKLKVKKILKIKIN